MFVLISLEVLKEILDLGCSEGREHFLNHFFIGEDIFVHYKDVGCLCDMQKIVSCCLRKVLLIVRVRLGYPLFKL